MKDKLCTIFLKYKSPVLYLFFGGLTTVINYLAYAACFFFFPVQKTTLPNLTAWVISVIFAYLTNRKWVFESSVCGVWPILCEMMAFAGSRIFTLLLETGILWWMVDRLGFPNLFVKFIANIIVIVLNYILSKLLVFKKTD